MAGGEGLKVGIRDLCRDDIGAVMAIERVSFPTPWPPKLFEEEIDRSFSDALVAVREEDGAVVGYAVCWTVADESHLLNIAVDPGVRGRGIGRALLAECIRRGAAAGAARILLEVRTGNDAARRLYEREGFSVAGMRKGYYTDTGEDAVVMTREIREDDAP